MTAPLSDQAAREPTSCSFAAGAGRWHRAIGAADFRRAWPNAYRAKHQIARPW